MSPFLPTFSTSERSTTRTSDPVRAGHGQGERRDLGPAPLRHRALRVGEQRHLTGRLDGRGHVALVLGAVPRDPPGPDLALVAHEPAQEVDVVVVDPMDVVRAEDADLLLPAPAGQVLGSPPGAAVAIVAAGHALEGLLVVGIAGRGLGRGGAGGATATPSRPVAGAPALVLGDAGRGPAQAGSDLVGHDLDLGALLTVGGLPRAL